MLPILHQLILSNNSLSSRIPTTIFTRPALQELLLDTNNFSGPIGEFHNPFAMLSTFDFSGNQLMSAAVPTSFSQLTALTDLYLDSNNFTGTLDLNPCFRLRNLDLLSASYNHHLLSVTANGHGSNSSCYNNSGISMLSLSGCSLTRIPEALRYLPHLSGLNISDNLIGGRTPDWIWGNICGFWIYLTTSSPRWGRSLATFP
jgi:Leucine-rich repeat (LRR) protein